MMCYTSECDIQPMPRAEFRSAGKTAFGMAEARAKLQALLAAG